MPTTNTFYQLCLPIHCSKNSQIWKDLLDTTYLFPLYFVLVASGIVYQHWRWLQNTKELGALWRVVSWQGMWLYLCLSFTFWAFWYLLAPIALHLSSVHLCGGSLPKLCQKKILYAQDCIRSGNGSQGAPAPLFVKTPQSVFLKQWFIAPHTQLLLAALSIFNPFRKQCFSLCRTLPLIQTCGQAV